RGRGKRIDPVVPVTGTGRRLAGAMAGTSTDLASHRPGRGVHDVRHRRAIDRHGLGPGTGSSAVAYAVATFPRNVIACQRSTLRACSRRFSTQLPRGFATGRVL